MECYIYLRNDKKWYGTLPGTLAGKMGLYSNSNGGTIQRYGHAVFKSISALTRGILKEKNGRDNTNFNADASITELLFGIIHSANQLSVHGAVTNWCEQFGFTEGEKTQEKQKESVTKGVLTSVESQELKLLVSSKTGIWKQFARKNQDFESLTETIRFTRVCEFASFWHWVSAGF